MIIPNNLTRAELGRVWARMEGEKRSLDAQYKRKFRRLLKADYAVFIEAYKSSGNGQIALAIAQVKIDPQPYFELYKELYTKVGLRYYKRAKERYIKPSKRKQTEEEVLDIIIRYINTYAGARIVGITTTTLSQMQAALTNVVTGQMSISQAITYLTKLFGLESDYRAERIARTEINAAANFGSIEWARQSGLNLTKTWLSASDKRVRGRKPKQKHSHFGMNGQTVGMEEAFTDPRSGERLLYPGDSSLGASAGNIINCRCTTVFTEIEE